MSRVADEAELSIFMADFANVDAAGKLNLIGGSVAVLGFDPQQGVTSRFSVAVSVHLPYELLPADFTFEIALVDGRDLVNLPGPSGPQPLRISQNVAVERPSSGLSSSVREHLGGNQISVLDFSNGLPLRVGGTYGWRVGLDGGMEKQWVYPFAVSGPPDLPVAG